MSSLVIWCLQHQLNLSSKQKKNNFYETLLCCLCFLYECNMCKLTPLCISAGLQQSPSQDAGPGVVPQHSQHIPAEPSQSSPTNQPGPPGPAGQPGQPQQQLQEPVQPFHQHNGAGPDITFPNEVGRFTSFSSISLTGEIYLTSQ